MHESSFGDSRRHIAIVGLSGRYPGGASTPAHLWANLKAGIDAVTEARGDRWDIGHHHPDPARPERVYTKACGLLEHIDEFDNEFFGLSPREARQVDPQQRLLLELAWEALEDASIRPDAIAGSDTGVFIGLSSNDYGALVGPQGPDAYTNTGSSFSIAANRISYCLDLHGPSVALDTACSSSIVGIHQACASLLGGDCSIALAGGVSLLVHIRPWVGFAKASMLSPTGRCKSFDASGDGYVRSEGGGIVVLKPLAAAERDGDSIYGVILASAVNSDGHTMGLSMPNVDAQEQVLRRVYRACGVAPEDVVYVEAHGTGTSVGDPIECESIGRVLGAPRTDGSTLLIGSVKSNIGHLEAASGMAGLTKALLALRHREVPANLHFTTPNPKIQFDAWKLAVVTATTPLPEREKPIVVGVNSFGFGGTNAHLAIAEYRTAAARPHPARQSADADPLLVLSAQTPAALRALAAEYAAFLRMQPDAAWSDICAAAAHARARLRHRLVVAAADASDAVARLERFLADEPPLRLATGSATGEDVPIGFVFSGNGPQWWGMGRELLAANPQFRREIEAVDALFAQLAGWSLIDEMARPEAQSRMALTEIAQPMLFAQQVALTAVLRSAGIRPAVTLGHSVGEVAAAHVAGALTLEEAVRIIFHRSNQQARTAGQGAMAAIGMSADEVAAAMEAIPGWLELAATNAPKAVTVAGDPAALEKLRAAVTEDGKFARVLPLQYAFHSRAMDPIEDDLIAALADLAPHGSTIPFMSTVDVAVKSGAELGAEYWWRNVREPVRFSAAVDQLIMQRDITAFIEIGPHPVLRDYILQCAKARDRSTVALASLRRPAANRPEPEADNLATAICACHANGVGKLGDVFDRPAAMPALPLYPWQRTRHWRGSTVLPDTHFPTDYDHPLLGYRYPTGDGRWENTLDTNKLRYLADHVVQGSIVFPAAGYVEMALSAARRMSDGRTVEVESFEILRPLTIPEQVDPLIQFSADADDGAFEIASRAETHSGDWTRNVRGRLSRSDDPQPTHAVDLEALKATLPCRVSGAEHYAAARGRGLAYGPAFAGIASIWMSDPASTRREALAEIDLPALRGSTAEYAAHPALTDSGIQVILTLIGQNEHRDCAIIPVSIERTRSYAPLPDHLFCRVTLKRESARSAVADFDFYDVDGNVLLTFAGARCQKVDFGRGPSSSLISEWWRPDPTRAAQLQPLTLPAPTRIVAAQSDAVRSAVRSTGREAFYRDVQPRIERLAAAFAARALLALGAAHGSFTAARLMRRGRVKPSREGLLGKLIAIAASDGQLLAGENGWAWNPDRVPAAPEPLWHELARDYPRYIAELLLSAQAGDDLVETLRVDPPADGAQPAGFDRIFDGAPFAAVYNRLAQLTLTAFVDAWPSGRPIRIIELGGGGGGLTAALLPALPAERTDYVFTDISEAALGRAEHRFAEFGFVRFTTFDFDAPPSAQSPAAGSFDIVIAGNALHAASDRESALAAIYALLAPGGALVAIESHASAFADLVFSQDRDASGLLDAATWRAHLAAAGFASTATLADAQAPDEPTQQTVFIAQKASTAEPAALKPEAAVEPRRWTIFVGPAEAGSAVLAALTARLLERGADARVRHLADGIALDDDGARALIEGDDADSIVHFASAGPPPRFAVPDAMREARCLSALKLVQAIVTVRHERPPQLSLVTRGALATSFGGPRNPGHAPLWGLGRVIANEHSGLGVRLIDLAAELNDADAGRRLADELLARDDESEVQLVDGVRYVNRERLTTLSELSRLAPPPAEALPFRLDFLPAGGLDSLHLRAIERRAPGPHDVEIAVEAAGLNFRDVLWAMGMLPEEAVEHGFSGPTIGMECAGTIARVGDAVRDLHVGDRVIAFASSCFASHVTTAETSVARIPDTLAFEEAATIPIAFLTAYYALDHLARLAPGETVLIHGAAGGVGLAAVQIAQLKGARVIGTAGSAAKRRMLEMMGVDHVLNSRSLEFADDVLRLTDGTGVDVVLNSLAGEAIAKGLGILRPFGRFLEIGKRDLYANSRIGLRPFRQNLSYFGIDADTLLIERTPLARELFGAVIDLFARGVLRPIPFTSVPVARASEAFRMMQQSRHVGKIVVSLRREAGQALPIVRDAVPVHAGGTYLVTGGLGGFGLTTAQWLVANGARSIALVGRRGAVTEEAQAGIAALEAAGAVVRAFAADIADPAAVAEVVGTIRAEMLPLRGVIHSAAVIEDAPIINISEALLARVIEPKLLGAWNVHAATSEDALELFVVYSSSSVMVGNPGQGAYVAANLFLESLVQYRRARGLPALAVGWGAIKDAGFLTRNAAVAEMLKNRSGLDATPAAEALTELGRLAAVDATRVCIAKFNLQRLGQLVAGARIPRFAPIIPKGIATDGQSTESLAERLQSAPQDDRHAIVVERVREHAGRVLGTGAANLDVERSLSDLGLDSLMAVELAEAVERDVERPISVMQMLGAGTIVAIADIVLRTLGMGAATELDGPNAAPSEAPASNGAHANGAHANGTHANVAPSRTGAEAHAAGTAGDGTELVLAKS
jgi:acyl transferase domain-containing protein/acyl carrier protein